MTRSFPELPSGWKLSIAERYTVLGDGRPHKEDLRVLTGPDGYSKMVPGKLSEAAATVLRTIENFNPIGSPVVEGLRSRFLLLGYDVDLS